MEKLDVCFASDEYRRIIHGRADNVDARALSVEEDHEGKDNGNLE